MQITQIVANTCIWLHPLLSVEYPPISINSYWFFTRSCSNKCNQWLSTCNCDPCVLRRTSSYICSISLRDKSIFIISFCLLLFSPNLSCVYDRGVFQAFYSCPCLHLCKHLTEPDLSPMNGFVKARKWLWNIFAVSLKSEIPHQECQVHCCIYVDFHWSLGE